jgi:hypothetical protein
MISSGMGLPEVKDDMDSENQARSPRGESIQSDRIGVDHRICITVYL